MSTPPIPEAPEPAEPTEPAGPTEPDLRFEEILLRLPDGLTQDEVGLAFDQVLAGGVSDVQAAAFLYGLRVRGETTAEVQAIADALLRAAPPLELDGPLVDIVGTGGDRTGAISLSTPASVLLAAVLAERGTAATVVKHGNRGASTPTGSADVIEAWGVPLDLDPRQVADVGRAAGITFCFAPRFHAALRHAAPARRALNVPTVMNVLGPLINPAQPTCQLVGVADATRVALVAEVFRARGRTVLVARGRDGLDKLTLSGPTDVTLVVDGQVVSCAVSPEDVGLDRSTLDALRGSTPADNAARLRAVLRGEDAGPVADAVVLNAAAALVLVEGPTPDPDDLVRRLREAVVACREILATGAAGTRLDTWVATARAHAG